MKERQQLCYECMLSVTMKKAVALMLKLETITNICLFLSHYQVFTREKGKAINTGILLRDILASTLTQHIIFTPNQ
jgi:DTW domain-containing protein YfiP